MNACDVMLADIWKGGYSRKKKKKENRKKKHCTTLKRGYLSATRVEKDVYFSLLSYCATCHY